MIGNLPENVLNALLETIPLEFSVIDANDEVLAWNKHDSRIFKRPTSVIGRNIRKCHPPKSLSKVEQILDEMKQGSRNTARFWIDIPVGNMGKKQKVHIQYFALRDLHGRYLGCLEATQSITEIQSLTGEKRLLD